MMFDNWAKRWGISRQAIDELRALFTVTPEVSTRVHSNEATNQAAVRLEASQKGAILWRNNVGACQDEKGHFMRYGLANDSKKVNDEIKSSDLIGIKPLRVGGYTIGQFVAREVKRSDWAYRGTAEEIAQLRFLQIVAGLGGDAAFCTGVGTIWT